MTKKNDRTRIDAASAPNGVVAQGDLDALATSEEQRSTRREIDVCLGITSFTMLPDGSYLEGVVKNVSDGGACIAGKIDGLSVGQSVDLGLVIQGQKIRYSCVIMNIDSDVNHYGVKFLSGPSPMVSDNRKVRHCIKCQRTYEPEFRFCVICGGELSRPRLA